MQKSVVIFGVILVIAIFFVAGFFLLLKPNEEFSQDIVKEQPFQDSPVNSQEPSPANVGGCDGVCDQFEETHPESACYKPDCLGIENPEGFDEMANSNSFHGPDEISVESLDSTYKSVFEELTGWFTSGQSAEILLSGVDFNNAGGGLLFNHQGGIATDGKHFILADRNNNRVLIWNSLPTGNTEPDLVLGQKNFVTNNPGDGLDELNWPVAVATDGVHLLVADTYNDRILIWNEFPTTNAEPADISLQGVDDPNLINNVDWPWDVWTNGEKVIVASTQGSQVLIWNSFPTKNNQDADITIKLEDFGTPRAIGSDGTNLIIGDHNAFGSTKGNFFWSTFPTKDNQMYDFFMENAVKTDDEILWGATFTETGKLIVLSDKLYFWDSFPTDENDEADFSIGGNSYDFSGSQGGDGSSIAYTDGKLYISLCNGNKIVGYNSLPETSREPDFAIGSPSIEVNTLETEFIMSNPVPATDGKSLFVSSDFDRKLYVWKSIPDESGANPDFVYSLTEAPWDNVLYENNLVLAGKKVVFIWKNLPLTGEMPDLVLTDGVGSVKFQELHGVTMDENYFYLSDNLANKVYVWNGIPDKNSEPVFVLDVNGPGRVSSDGEYLAVNSVNNAGGAITIFKISELSNPHPATVEDKFNLPQGVLVYDGHLFVGDTGFNVVHIWTDIKDALLNKEADIVLGEKGRTPSLSEGKFFWPATMAFDGSHLWVGEFKFSERLLRFDVE